jgi:hypothetical protein
LPEGHCKICLAGSGTRKKFLQAIPDKYLITYKPGEAIGFDLQGPFPVGSLSDSIYACVGKDKDSRKTFFKGLKTKDEGADAVITTLTFTQTQTGNKVKLLRTDGGGEFVNKTLKDWSEKNGVEHSETVPHTSQHNGIVERANRSILNMVRSMLLHAGAPCRLWAEAAAYAVELYNDTTLVKGRNKTPNQIWNNTNEPTSIDQYYVWGCDVMAHINQKDQPHRLAPRGEQMILLGWCKTRLGFKLLDPTTGKIKYNRDVTPFERSFKLMHSYREECSDDEPDSVREQFFTTLEKSCWDAETTMARYLSLSDEEKRQSGSVYDILRRHDAASSAARGGDRSADDNEEEKKDEGAERRSTRSAEAKRPPMRYGQVDMKDMGNANAARLQPAQQETQQEQDEREARRQKATADATISRAVEDSDPYLNRSGQAKAPSQRCTSDNRRGTQCKTMTSNGHLCWIHLLKRQGVRISRSVVAGAGKGLKAGVDFVKGQSVSEYVGDWVYEGDDETNSAYIFEISTKLGIDAARTNSAPGRMVNDARGTELHNNCRWVVDMIRKKVRIVTTRAVKKGEEFLIGYSKAYWKQFELNKSKKKQGLTVSCISFSVEAAAKNAKHLERDPATYAEAMRDPDHELWAEAVKKELNSFDKHGVFKVVDSIPSGKSPVTGKLVLKRKVNSAGEVVSYKARIVARGFTQKQGIDFTETYAPVLGYKVLRALVAVAAALDWEIKQSDVETAFLHGVLKETIYMRPPTGIPGIKSNQFWLLLKTLYGLKQAGREWYLQLVKVLNSLGFYACENEDECLFIKQSASGLKLILGVFVDDIVRVYSGVDEKEMAEVMRQIGQRFTLKDLGDAEHILGIKVTRDRKNKTLHLTQTAMIDKLLKEYGMDVCRTVSTPEDRDSDFDDNHTVKSKLDKEEPNWMDAHPQVTLDNYPAIVGSIQYLATSTRPDLAHAISTLSRKLANADEDDVRRLKRVLRYLAGTRTLGLTYSGLTVTVHDQQFKPVDLLIFSDSDWGGEYSTGKSQTGFVIKLAGAAVGWVSQKQDTVAHSSSEAEYVALSECGRETVWWRRVMAQVGLSQLGPTLQWVDNTVAERMANGEGGTKRRKHINVKYHWIREQVVRKELKLSHIPTAINEADILTKSLQRQPFERLRDLIMGLSHDKHPALTA